MTDYQPTTVDEFEAEGQPDLPGELTDITEEDLLELRIADALDTLTTINLTDTPYIKASPRTVLNMRPDTKSVVFQKGASKSANALHITSHPSNAFQAGAAYALVSQRIVKLTNTDNVMNTLNNGYVRVSERFVSRISGKVVSADDRDDTILVMHVVERNPRHDRNGNVVWQRHSQMAERVNREINRDPRGYDAREGWTQYHLAYALLQGDKLVFTGSESEQRELRDAFIVGFLSRTWRNAGLPWERFPLKRLV
jgi:hypothetical protein